MQEPPFQDRRKQKDRRQKPTSPLTLWGQRRHIRRKDDRDSHLFVDRYSIRAVIALFAIAMLSLVDAFLTLRLISLGAAREVNPVMDYFIRQGPTVFLAVKYSLTGLCLIGLLVLKNVRYLRGRIHGKTIIVLILLLYVALVVYELSLFHRLDGRLFGHGRDAFIKISDGFL